VHARKVSIKLVLEPIRDVLVEAVIPVDVKKRLIRKQLKRIASESTPYETAIKQCVTADAEWRRLFPVLRCKAFGLAEVATFASRLTSASSLQFSLQHVFHLCELFVDR
jgi:hypothetical protein